MKAWLINVTNDFLALVDAYPAMVLFIIILLIAMALLWIWFKVPAVSIASDKSHRWTRILVWIKDVFLSTKAMFTHLIEHMLINSGEAYKTPLYLQLKPQNSPSPLNALPTSLTQRNAPEYLRNMLSQADDDNWYLLKDMTLVELSVEASGEASQGETSANRPLQKPLQMALQASLKRISRIRPQRPIDGIVISIPAKMLINETSPKLIGLIEGMVLGLSVVDSEVPFALPIYLMVSDCESIEGFDAFAQQNWDRHEQMFGYSSDIEFGEKYHRSVVRRAFASIYDQITRNQVEQSAKAAALVQGDQYVLLEREIAKLSKATERVCEALFDDPSHKNGFYFRGIYFVGSGLKESNSDAQTGNVFIHDVLQKKIYAESNLAFPTIRGLLSHRQFLNRYKQISIVLLALLFTLGGLNLWSLKKQINSVTNTLVDFQVSDYSGRKSYAQVYRVLDQLSLIDAREFKRLGLPASWFAGIDDRLVQIISDNHLANIVFPAMECTLGTQFANLLRTPPQFADSDNDTVFQAVFAEAWLNELEQFQAKRHGFIDLSKPSSAQNTDVLQRFSDLMYALYGAKPASGFFTRSDLYQRSIERLNYPYLAGNPDCIEESSGVDNLSSTLFWNFVYQNAQRFYTEIQKTSLSPSGPVGQQDVVGTGRSYDEKSLLALNRTGSDGQELVQTSRWFDYLEHRWLGNNKNTNPCREMHQRLSALHIDWSRDTQTATNTAARSVALFNKANCDDIFYKQLLRNNYDLIGKPFIRDSAGNVQFSPGLLAFKGNHTSVQDLSFMSLDTSNVPRQTPDVIFWDQTRLINALGYFKEYEYYARINFASVALEGSTTKDTGGTHALQAAMITQLKNAIFYEIAWAKQGAKQGANQDLKRRLINADNKVKTDRSQALVSLDQVVSERVDNFKAVDELFYQLHAALTQLGLSNDSESWIEVTRASALSVLQHVDALTSDSRLYLPETPLDPTKPRILNALYGLNSANQVTTYLEAQHERAAYIAFNYAQNVLTYLLNSGLGLTANQSLLEKTWSDTLVELDKYARKNPNNAMTALESQFSDALPMTLADCQSDHRIKPGIDIFTNAQNDLATSIKIFCGRIKATSAVAQYNQLITLFNATLAGRYPFVDQGQIGTLTKADASVFAVRNFFREFDVVSDALLAEFEQKNDAARAAGQASNYAAPLQFVQQLKTTSDFLSASLNQTNGTVAGLVNIKPTFKVYATPTFAQKQILSRSISINGQSAASPGKGNEIEWQYGVPIDFNARLANTSVFRFYGASNNRLTVSSLSMTFRETGPWALFRMLQRYRVSPPLQPTVANSGSIILEFSLPVKRTTAVSTSTGITAPPLVNSVFTIAVGIDLYGLNPQTQQRELLKLPDSFPFSAPTL